MYCIVGCDIVTDGSEQNENISTSASRSSRRTLTNSKNVFFVCNDKSISDNNTCNEGATGRCEIDCAKECLIERSKYFESEPSSQFKEA